MKASSFSIRHPDRSHGNNKIAYKRRNPYLLVTCYIVIYQPPLLEWALFMVQIYRNWMIYQNQKQTIFWKFTCRKFYWTYFTFEYLRSGVSGFSSE